MPRRGVRGTYESDVRGLNWTGRCSRVPLHTPSRRPTPMRPPARRILVLYWHPKPMKTIRAAIKHHLYALESSEANHSVIYYNAAAGAPAWLRHADFDAVILHTTLLCLRWSDLFDGLKGNLSWIRDLECLKIAMPQDEYDHSEILDEWLHDWGVSVICTTFDPDQRPLLYPILHDQATFCRVFTGYIDETLARECAGRITPLHARPKDLVYRATRLPYWFGSHGQLKHHIAERVAGAGSSKGLTCDISTRYEDTIVGNAWMRFLASGKAVIGCESGSSVLDRRGEIKASIQARLRNDGNLSFDQATKALPSGWDEHRFFAIGPRHFEAVMTKTCQILVEGEYDGVLLPGKHYLPVKRDLTNVDDVLDALRDLPLMQAMVDRAYEEIHLSGQYTYRRLARQLDECLQGAVPRKRARRTCLPKVSWTASRVASRLATFKVSAHDTLLQIKRSLR